ncbi:MAG: ChaN family lipoprotein [Myxococcota bacterium]
MKRPSATGKASLIRGLGLGFALGAMACGPPPAPRVPTPGEVAPGARVTAKGATSSFDQLLDEAAASDGVCVGEVHDDALHHRLQHAVLGGVLARAPEAAWAVGFEMLRQPSQPVLDRYAAGTIDIETFRRESNWDEDWGFGFDMYRPLFESGRDRGLDLLALNAPRELTRAISKGGVARLAPELRQRLPELDLADPGHRRFFFAAMGFDDPAGPHGGGSSSGEGGATNADGDPVASDETDGDQAAGDQSQPHHHGGMNPEFFYAAQVTWDESMADGAARWLTRNDRRVVIIAGNGHCHRAAVPNRVERRRPGRRVLSILLQNGPDGAMPHTESDFVVTLPTP